MEISGTVHALLSDKNRELRSITPNDTVYTALEMMAAENIGALPVLQDGTLVGLVSERDYTRKVALQGRSSRETRVGKIMTRNPHTVALESTIDQCMLLMTEKRVRHLPVLEHGEIVGILSIGDVVKWVISAQTATIDQLTRYVYGEP